MAPKKNSSRRKKLRANLVKAIYELIEDKIDDFIQYEEHHLFDIDEIDRVLRHNIDRRIARIQAEDLEEEITTRRRRGTRKGIDTVRLKVCSVAGCTRPVKSRGLCATHYQAALREEKRRRKK